MCVDSLFVSKSILFYQRAELKTSSTSATSLRSSYVSPSQIHQEIIRKKSLLADTETSTRMCFFMFFFYTFQVFHKKSPWKMMLLENYDNIPCKGWQKNCSASRVGTTIFHLQKGSHFAVTAELTRDFSDGEVDSDKENANSQRHCRRCRNAAVFFLCLFYPSFWLGTGTTTKTQLEAERDLFGTNGKGYIESIW